MSGQRQQNIKADAEVILKKEKVVEPVEVPKTVAPRTLPFRGRPQKESKPTSSQPSSTSDLYNSLFSKSKFNL